MEPLTDTEYRSARRSASEESGEAPPSEGERVGVFQFAEVLLSRWKLVAGLPLAAAFVTAGISLLIPPRFTAMATFVPEAQESSLSLPSGIVGLAAQFGFPLMGAGASSPYFYAQVMQSRTLADSVLLAGFADPRTEEPGDTAVLLDLLEVEGDTEIERLEAGRVRLDELSAFGVDSRTEVVRVIVETRYPQLSADVANYYIELLNRFNLDTRQSNAQAQRQFVERRVAEAERELWEAEEALKTFLERNRQYAGSPELKFQYDRLNRQVALKQEVLSTLRRQYEETRIQEVNDTPVITVIDRAVPPVEKSSPQRTSAVILAFAIACVLSVTGAFSIDYLDRARSRDQADYQRLTSRWAGLKAELRGFLRRG